MKKYPVRNTIFEGKCFILDMDLDDIVMVESVNDLVADYGANNPYYGKFLGVMKYKQYECYNMYNRMCCNVEYSSNEDRFYFFKPYISYKRIGIIGLMKYLKLRGLDSITNYNYNGNSNSKLLLMMMQERR